MNIKLTEKDKIRVSQPEDIFGIMQRILLRDNKIDQEKEHFWIIGMNNGGYIVYIELISLGSSTKTLVEPMNVFRVAILKGAVRVIAIHNHPSGTIKASKEDEDVTDRLIQVGKIISIEVNDHLIITPTSYISFRETGLMDKLESSIKYIPQYQLIEKIRQEEKAIRNEVQKELKQTQQQVYKAISLLLDKGVDSAQIVDILNVSLKDVNRIDKKRLKK
ncbi:MAG: hypothetical protein RL662_1873 [Bacteroidota bacterium]|jgi:DNA repair protein RadC